MDEERQGSEQQEGVLLKLSYDELQGLLDASADRAVGAAVDGASETVLARIDSLASVGSTVALDDAQFQRLSDLGATGLHGSVVCVGLLSLILGAVVATAVTLHWRR